MVYEKDELIFATEHLNIVPITLQDQIELLKILQDPNLMQLGWGKTFSLTETRQWLEKIQQQYHQFGYSYFFIIEKATGEIVGLVGGLKTEIQGRSEVELAYIIKPFAQGHGYAHEAASGMLEFLHLKGVPSVIAQFVPANKASKKVAEALGLTYAGHYPRNLNGQLREHLIYRKELLPF